MIDAISEHIEKLNTQLVHLETDQHAALAQVATRLTQCLLNEGKIVTLGAGLGSSVAQFLSAGLMHRLDRDRPGLPSLCINSLGTEMATYTQSSGGSQAAAELLRPLANPEQDLLVVFSQTGDERSLQRALQSAHEVGLGVILISGNEGGIDSLTHHDDQEITLPAEQLSECLALHFVAAQILIKLVEQELFGPST